MTSLKKEIQPSKADLAKDIVKITLAVRKTCFIEELTKWWPEIPRGDFLSAIDTLSMESYPIYQSDDDYRIGITEWK